VTVLHYAHSPLDGGHPWDAVADLLRPQPRLFLPSVFPLHKRLHVGLITDPRQDLSDNGAGGSGCLRCGGSGRIINLNQEWLKPLYEQFLTVLYNVSPHCALRSVPAAERLLQLLAHPPPSEAPSGVGRCPTWRGGAPLRHGDGWARCYHQSDRHATPL